MIGLGQLVAPRTTMPPLYNPDVADLAPNGRTITAYDEEHAITYMRMRDGADWQEVCRIVLHIDPEHCPDRARRAFDSHLTRRNRRLGSDTGSCFSVVGLLVHKWPMPHGWRAGWALFAGSSTTLRLAAVCGTKSRQ